MSYILDALRRAERERQMGKAPSVESLHPLPNTAPAAIPLRVRVLGAATIIVTVAAALVWLWPGAHPPAPPPASVDVAPAPAPLVTPPPAPAPAAAREAQLPTGIEDDPQLGSLDDVTAEQPADDSGGAPVASLQPQDVAVDAAGSSVAPAPATTPAAIPAAAAPATQDEHATIAVPAGTTVLREMPESYRAQFPVRRLDVHVYDPDPARRWVMIDGRRYNEGQTTDSGARIVEIIDTGVVFDFQGAQVLMPVR